MKFIIHIQDSMHQYLKEEFDNQKMNVFDTMISAL
jgi:uncharacterized protein YlbG (UPF0298 family)